MSKEKILCVIPARSGSKRLHHKNILEIAGKPLIAHTIEAALQSTVIDKVIVSTDDEEIALISQKYNAEVPFIRPTELSDDSASSINVIIHCIDYFKSKSIYFDYVILLQPTSPLRTSDDIDKAFELISKKTRAVVSVCKSEHPPSWMYTLSDGNYINIPDYKNSTEGSNFYRLNGAIYISEIDDLYKNKSFIGCHTKAFIMPAEKSIDIDTRIDFELCKILLNESN